ncbi:DUF6326 family protein [Bacteroidota bacterium]
MNTIQKTTKMDMKVKLSTLWIFVMINMIMADIVGFMNPGALESIIKGDVDVQITQELLLIFSVLLEIPILMIVLSRVLNYKANRWTNIIASVITILFVVWGGTTSLSYIFFASIEVVTMLLITWYAWKWAKP